MAEITARITMPRQARRGEIIEIRVLARHPMERAVDAEGLTPIPRKIIHTFVATYAGAEILRMALSSGIASNPYIAFTTVAVETGEIAFEWHEDGGEVFRRAQSIEVV